jgi:RNA polymerase sigma-70 factor, ECF subfamily
MTECRRVAQTLVPYACGELEEDDCARVEAHLRRCARCAGDVRHYRLILRLFRQLPDVPLPRRLVAGLRQAFPGPEGDPRPGTV